MTLIGLYFSWQNTADETYGRVCTKSAILKFPIRVSSKISIIFR